MYTCPQWSLNMEASWANCCFSKSFHMTQEKTDRYSLLHCRFHLRGAYDPIRLDEALILSGSHIDVLDTEMIGNDTFWIKLSHAIQSWTGHKWPRNGYVEVLHCILTHTSELDWLWPIPVWQTGCLTATCGGVFWRFHERGTKMNFVHSYLRLWLKPQVRRVRRTKRSLVQSLQVQGFGA